MSSNRRKVEVYLVLRRDPKWGAWAKVVKKSNHRPRLERGQCAVRVTVTVPDEAFDPVFTAPETAIDVVGVLRADVGKAKP